MMPYTMYLPDGGNNWQIRDMDNKIVATMNDQQEREAFEAWAREYSTYPLERDDEPAFGTTGYTSMEQTMLWDAWQARAGKAKAPEGASGGDLDANARPGLAGANDTCRHEFALSPSSGILLCAKCGIGEVAANKQARAALAATPAPADPSDADKDLAMMLRRCASALQAAGREEIAAAAMGLLGRLGLGSSPLRERQAATPAPAPAAPLRDAQEQPFEDWWEREGQFCRAGGGDYERSFAWAAWRATKAEAKPLTDERIEALRQIDDCGEAAPEFARIVRIAERACAEAWGVKLAGQGKEAAQ